MLLRSYAHIVFDRGYITITPEHRIEFSKRLRTDRLEGRIESGIRRSRAPAYYGSDGTIYFGSDDHNLYAITDNGTSYTEKWAFATTEPLHSSPAIGSDGTIYVGSYNQNLYAINPDGSEKWEFTTGDTVDSSPAIGADGTIYVGSNDNNLYAVGPLVTLSPAKSLSFGAQLVGTRSAAQKVTLSNGQSVALDISSITASGDFHQTNTCGSSLKAGKSCTISVTFKPTTTGAFSGTLTVADDASNAPQTASLSGTGIARR